MAKVKISQLPHAETLAGDELIAGVKGNVTVTMTVNEVNGKVMTDLIAPEGVALVGNAADKRVLAGSTGAAQVGYNATTVDAELFNLGQTKSNAADLIDSTDNELGAALVGFDGGPVDVLLENAQSMADYAALRAYAGRAKGIRLTAQVIGGTFQVDPLDTTSLDDGGLVIVDPVGRRWKRVYDGPVDVRWFGAKGNGIEDDTAAINLALATDAEHVHFSRGRYLISDALQNGDAVLVSNRPERKITCDGVITANSRTLRVMGVYGDDSFVQLNIDGNLFAATGVSCYGKRISVENCFIKDLFGDNFSAAGITSGGDASPVFIRNNKIIGVNANGNSTLGDGIGLCRGVSVSFTVSATEMSVVEGNFIKDVSGEEGDAIAVSAFASGVGYLVTNTMVRNNIIQGFNRRAVKIQSHDNKVIGNHIKNYFTDQSEIPNSLTVIDLVQGGNQTVRDNIIENCKFFTGISVFALAGESFDNIFIENNRLIGVGIETAKAGISVTSRGKNVVIRWNYIQSGTGSAIACGTSENVSIEGNIIRAVDNATNRVISITTGVVNACVMLNTLLEGARRSFIETDSGNVVVFGNTNRVGTPHFRNSGSGKNSVIIENVVQAASIYSDTATLVSNQFGNNYHMGSQSNTAPGVLFVGSGGPAINLAGIYVSTGQRVYTRSPVAGGSEGWIALTSGLAESVTWKTFGAIAA